MVHFHPIGDVLCEAAPQSWESALKSQGQVETKIFPHMLPHCAVHYGPTAISKIVANFCHLMRHGFENYWPQKQLWDVNDIRKLRLISKCCFANSDFQFQTLLELELNSIELPLLSKCSYFFTEMENLFLKNLVLTRSWCKNDWAVTCIM